MVTSPPGWGNDELSKFLQRTHDNHYAIFATKRVWYEKLSAVNDLFFKVAINIINPPEPVATALSYRSHSAFLAACECAMAGQIVESMVLDRSCLENAAYALHIHSHAGLDVLWLNRNQSDAEMKAMKKEFTNGKLRETIGNCDNRLLNIFDHLYERSIDFGGHPNQRGVAGSVKLERDEERSLFVQTYLHGDGLPLDHALKTTAQAGICALRISQFMMKAKFELLGIRASIEQVQQGL
jgi:hypothetical protein